MSPQSPPDQSGQAKKSLTQVRRSIPWPTLRCIASANGQPFLVLAYLLEIIQLHARPPCFWCHRTYTGSGRKIFGVHSLTIHAEGLSGRPPATIREASPHSPPSASPYCLPQQSSPARPTPSGRRRCAPARKDSTAPSPHWPSLSWPCPRRPVSSSS